MRPMLNVLYCHGLGSSINNRVGVGLVEFFRDTQHYFERLLYRNPGSRTKLWNISEWREDIERRGLFLFCPGVSLSFKYVDSFVPGGLAALDSGKTVDDVTKEKLSELLAKVIQEKTSSISRSCSKL
ncbi:unnamed protein product [Nippostrongylus brasiliensis]|uniref:Hydrolase_4 domain-containing protein n=1 Tax=Nippostrongylus brasiliensis TaxID=27835 RepID=A0A0N4XVI8_NIPBR|nr:unnamed protein product [Nippostrongylus brasiliensis]